MDRPHEVSEALQDEETDRALQAGGRCSPIQLSIDTCGGNLQLTQHFSRNFNFHLCYYLLSTSTSASCIQRKTKQPKNILFFLDCYIILKKNTASKYQNFQYLFSKINIFYLYMDHVCNSLDRHKRGWIQAQLRNQRFCTLFQWFLCKLCLMSSPDLLQTPHSAGLMSRLYSCWT